jgi:hypothetical protein
MDLPDTAPAGIARKRSTRLLVRKPLKERDHIRDCVIAKVSPFKPANWTIRNRPTAFGDGPPHAGLARCYDTRMQYLAVETGVARLSVKDLRNLF